MLVRAHATTETTEGDTSGELTLTHETRTRQEATLVASAFHILISPGERVYPFGDLGLSPHTLPLSERERAAFAEMVASAPSAFLQQARCA